MPDMNPAVLDAVHEDLKDGGAGGGRDSTYGSEQLLRAILVKRMEGFSFRDTIVRIAAVRSFAMSRVLIRASSIIRNG